MSNIIVLPYHQKLPLKKQRKMKRLLLQLLAILLFGMMYAQQPLKLITIQKPQTHSVGEKWGGGIVISVDPSGLHGLIVEATDLKFGPWSWYSAVEIMKLECVHSSEGAKFSDWRLPTEVELNKLILLKDFIGGFISGSYGGYWSTWEDENNPNSARIWFSDDVSSIMISPKLTPNHVRAVRNF